MRCKSVRQHASLPNITQLANTDSPSLLQSTCLDSLGRRTINYDLPKPAGRISNSDTQPLACNKKLLQQLITKSEEFYLLLIELKKKLVACSKLALDLYLVHGVHFPTSIERAHLIELPGLIKNGDELVSQFEEGAHRAPDLLRQGIIQLTQKKASRNADRLNLNINLAQSYLRQLSECSSALAPLIKKVDNDIYSSEAEAAGFVNKEKLRREDYPLHIATSLDRLGTKQSIEKLVKQEARRDADYLEIEEYFSPSDLDSTQPNTGPSSSSSQPTHNPYPLLALPRVAVSFEKAGLTLYKNMFSDW